MHAQSCLTVTLDCSPPGSCVYGISQARILEWVAISSSRGSSRARDQTRVPVAPALAGGFFTTELSGKPVSAYRFLLVHFSLPPNGVVLFIDSIEHAVY